MSSRRCSICCEDWPDLKQFGRCPCCGEPTWVNDDSKPHKSVGLPKVHRQVPPHVIDRQAREFRRWLDTVGPDDFAKSL